MFLIGKIMLVRLINQRGYMFCDPLKFRAGQQVAIIIVMMPENMYSTDSHNHSQSGNQLIDIHLPVAV